MKRKMFSVIAMLLLVVIMLLALTGCGTKTFVCGWCGREVTGKSHQVELMGDKYDICDECYKELKEFSQGFGD